MFLYNYLKLILNNLDDVNFLFFVCMQVKVSKEINEV